MINENQTNGWIKLYRSFIDWEWFDVPNMITIYIYCLLKANHKDNTWRGILIKKGSFITSLETISKDTNISVQSVRTCLKRLEKTKEINKQSNKQYTVVTICKYDVYQDLENKSTYETTNKQQSTNKQLTTNKNVNNDNNTTTKEVEVDFLKVDSWIKEIGKSDVYLEGLYRLHKLYHGSIHELTNSFKEHLKVYPKIHSNFSDFKKHFASWMQIKNTKGELKKYQKQTKGQL